MYSIFWSFLEGNGMESITTLKLAILIYIVKLDVKLVVKLWKTNYKPWVGLISQLFFITILTWHTMSDYLLFLHEKYLLFFSITLHFSHEKKKKIMARDFLLNLSLLFNINSLQLCLAWIITTLNNDKTL